MCFQFVPGLLLSRWDRLHRDILQQEMFIYGKLGILEKERNKTEVISAGLLGFDFDFEEISFLMTFHF